MKIVVIGTGYVGLVTGTCLASYNNTVVCVDTDIKRVKVLCEGVVPFYEPSLGEIMTRNMREGRLSFTSDYKVALEGADVCFITVGTPSSDDGSANLSYVESAARGIGRSMSGDLLLVVKSTVPVGTNSRVRDWTLEELRARGANYNLMMASNPEFLREGVAVGDFLDPDRVVVGTNPDDTRARALMSRVYAFLESSDKPGVTAKSGANDRLIFTDIASSEMAKYASNAMLACRISFMNEIASICDRVGADVESVRRAMGMDTRIGAQFLKAGCGYGGSCFPKDVRALRDFALNAGYDPELLNAIENVNARAKKLLLDKLHERLGEKLAGKTIAVWGLAFKPRTSDTREAPAHVLIRGLLAEGARVQATDPQAIAETRQILGEHENLTYTQDFYEAARDADALVLVTEWKLYHQPDFEQVKSLMKKPLLIDGRNLYSPDEMRTLGFDYVSVGRPSVYGCLV